MARRRKGFEVYVAKLAEQVIKITAHVGDTVKDALDKAGITAGAGSIRMGGERVPLTRKLKAGDVITVVAKVQGG